MLFLWLWSLMCLLFGLTPLLHLASLLRWLLLLPLRQRLSVGL